MQHNKSRVQGAEKERGWGAGHRPHSCNDNRQQLQSKKLNMQNEAIERGQGERGAGSMQQFQPVRPSSSLAIITFPLLSAGGGEWQAGCQRRQRLPQHCNFDVLATGWLRHSGTTTTRTMMMWAAPQACSVLCEVNS